MEIKPLYVPIKTHKEVSELAESRGQFLQATTLEIITAGLKVIKPGKKTKPAKHENQKT